MTNRDKMNGMGTEEFAREVNTFARCEARPYVDYEKWLGSEDEEYPIRGIPAMYSDYGRWEPCIKVLDFVNCGVPYAKIIVSLPGLHEFRVLEVPAKKVKVQEG